MKTLRATLLAISAIGAASFGSLFVLSWVRPVLVEKLAQDVVRHEVEKEVGEKLAALDGTWLGRVAKRELAAGLSDQVAAVAAAMQDPNCPCRKFIAEVAITMHSAMQDRLVPLIRAKYLHVAAALLRELRIFSGANALVFILLGVITWVRRRAGLQLILPAVVLVGAAGVVGALYIFGQDWLHTIVFNDYVGLGYFAYLGVAVAFLADVVFNRARVSTQVVNAAFNLVGAAIQAVPC